MDTSLNLTYLERDATLSRKRAVSDVDILFNLLNILRGGNAGGPGLENLSNEYGLSTGIMFNYIRNIMFTLLKVLNVYVNLKMCWPRSIERK